MPYMFDEHFFSDMQSAFLSVVIQSDLFEYSDIERRDYFLLHFVKKPVIVFDEKNTVNMILNGDKKITDLCNHELGGLAEVELGLRWIGLPEDTRKIIFSDFCIKIIYSEDKVKLRYRVVGKIVDFLKSQRLVDSSHDLFQRFISSVIPKMKNQYQFFTFPVASKIDPKLINSAINYIKTHISPVLPAYIRQNEGAMNPAYQDITVIRDQLFLDEKKIWLFRSDFIVATGNKNAYWISFSENSLSDVIDPRLHKYINWEDRYGHPSLAAEYPGFKGSAFYGGLLAQRNGFLEVLTSSGRYYRNDLTEKDKKMVEGYLSYVFQQAYGKQRVVFIDALSNADYFECSLFYQNQMLPQYCPRREYDDKKIESIFDEIISCDRSLK